MLTYVHLLLIFVPSLVLAYSPVVAVGDLYPHRIAALTTDAAGNTYVAGARVFNTNPPPVIDQPNERTDAFVAKFNAAGDRLWIQYFSGKGNDSATSLALDREGNIYVGGSTTSINFPLRNPLQEQPGGAFLIKLPADGSGVLWSTYYGSPGTFIASVAIAPDDTLVISGSLPDGSYMFRSYVAKIDSSANRILWTQQYPGREFECSALSGCFFPSHFQGALTALDATGNIYAAGYTNAGDFPTTPGAFLEHGYGTYIRKFNPAGDVLWSTYLSNNHLGFGSYIDPGDVVTAFTVSAEGAIYLTGVAGPAWPVTPGAYRTEFEGPPWTMYAAGGSPNNFLAKFDSNGTSLRYSTFLPHTGVAPKSIAIDAAGNAYVAGGLERGADYLAVIDAGGNALLSDAPSPVGSRGAAIAVDSSGYIHAAGTSGVVTVFSRTADASGLFGIANAAGNSITSRVAPGELISLYGWNLGDEVWVDESRAPVLYTAQNQVNAIVPFAAAGRDWVTVKVRRNGLDTASAIVAIAPAQPEIFKTPQGMAAALNEDGTLNTEDHPATPGSVVSVWVTGVGGWPAHSTDGATIPITPLIYLPFTGLAGYYGSSEVTFAGAAPGLVAGVAQLNIRLPSASTIRTLNPLPIAILNGNESSALAFIWMTL